MYRKLLLISSIITLMLSIFDNAMAQEISISGTVKDDSGNLPGVTVSLLKSDKGTITDIDGNFIIKSSEKGIFILQFSSVGYKTQEKELQINENKDYELGIIFMEQSMKELNEIIVSGTYYPSQQRAFEIQRKATNIQNVLASDGIGKLPDRNAAEAIQRIPGVVIERDQGEGKGVSVRGTPLEWNSVLINGNRLPATNLNESSSRDVSLDLFPSELIEYVAVSKTLTPDMEGDAIGGSINITTRNAPKEKLFNASMATGYHGQSEKPSYNGSLVYGDRHGKFGYILSASIWDRQWASESYELVYNVGHPELTPNEQFSIQQQEIRRQEGRRTTLGTHAMFDYEFNENHTIYLGGLYDYFANKEFVWDHIYQMPEIPELGTPRSNQGKALVSARDGIMYTTLWGINLGGKHQLNPKLHLDWEYATYNSFVTSGDKDENGKRKGFQVAQFSQDMAYSNLSSDTLMYWDFDSPNGKGASGDAFLPSSEQQMDPDALKLDLIVQQFRETKETDHVGQFNFEYIPNDRSRYKFGAKMKLKEKSYTQNSQYRVTSPFLPKSSLSDYELENFDSKGNFLEELDTPYEHLLLDQKITEGAFNQLIADALKNPNVANQSEIEKDFMALYYGQGTPTGADYYQITLSDKDNLFTAKENVFAVYALGDWQLTDKLSLLAGARGEMTLIEIQSTSLGEEGEKAKHTDKKSDYISVLPMVHLKYALRDNANIRLSYTKSLARPNFGQLNPGASSSFSGGMLNIVQGNTDLTPTYSHNFDLLGEYYFKDVGLFSGGVFYKKLNNVIYSYYTQTGNVVMTEFKNSDGWVAGFETAFSKRLTFLPGFLSGLGVECNYTFIQSETDITSSTLNDQGQLESNTTKQTLPKQPDHTFNTSLFYEKDNVLVRVAGNYKGAYIDNFNSRGDQHFRYYDKNFTVDLNASYSFSEKVRIFLEVNNLTNEPLRYYHGTNKQRTDQVEYYSMRGQIGLNYKF
ncbi:TonB-dependent receptor [Aureibacter tunicatorum]|uniref:TonB-dependent receptor n=1 Tax=Aureibacter tunicatorum TaxID=866807 RepID=A0AAE4BPQ9_9BACT|nr:TonB-dependent receptor [Aureibacter tunicatorum]MDR6238254.1 TonB-dependent receptor [Aureibacter tunicatorum]BDD03287.1 TonB-dependent receptor [Aureibacter tunicatorum]